MAKRSLTDLFAESANVVNYVTCLVFVQILLRALTSLVFGTKPCIAWDVGCGSAGELRGGVCYGCIVLSVIVCESNGLRMFAS